MRINIATRPAASGTATWERSSASANAQASTAHPTYAHAGIAATSPNSLISAGETVWSATTQIRTPTAPTTAMASGIVTGCGGAPAAAGAPPIADRARSGWLVTAGASRRPIAPSPRRHDRLLRAWYACRLSTDRSLAPLHGHHSRGSSTRACDGMTARSRLDSRPGGVVRCETMTSRQSHYLVLPANATRTTVVGLLLRAT